MVRLFGVVNPDQVFVEALGVDRCKQGGPGTFKGSRNPAWKVHER